MDFLGGLNGADAAGVSGRREKKREKRVLTRVYALELSVVGAAAGGVDETPGNARNEELVGDHELGY
jgi:hypothetical protein